MLFVEEIMADLTKEQVVKIMREERLVMMASLSESGKILSLIHI